jgi:Mobilization protein NikA
MRQDAIIKFRATAVEKERLRLASVRAGRSVSALLRKAAKDIASRRSVDGELRKDLVALRKSLNVLVHELSDMQSKASAETAKDVVARLLMRLA